MTTKTTFLFVFPLEEVSSGHSFRVIIRDAKEQMGLASEGSMNTQQGIGIKTGPVCVISFFCEAVKTWRMSCVASRGASIFIGAVPNVGLLPCVPCITPIHPSPHGGYFKRKLQPDLRSIRSCTYAFVQHAAQTLCVQTRPSSRLIGRVTVCEFVCANR